MKIIVKTKCIVTFVILLLMMLPVTLFGAYNSTSPVIINENAFLNQASDAVYLAVLQNDDTGIIPDASSGSVTNSPINYHRILGLSTLGMMAVTIGSGFFIPEKGHCGLAGVTTGLAVATCVDGIYEYGGLISITDGDWKYTTHAIMGVLATSGFITTLALADGDGHVVSGIASGVAFSIALAVIYF